jgi:hypothetical protein
VGTILTCRRLASPSPSHRIYLFHYGFPGPIGSLLWEKEVKEVVRNELIQRMMSWIPWTQALIRMLLVVAGMFTFSIQVFLYTLSKREKKIWYSLNSSRFDIYTDIPGELCEWLMLSDVAFAGL